jgi:hypothetical protein
MADITAFYEIAQSFTVELDKRLYFRVDVLREDTGHAIQTTKYFAEVYHLLWPNKVLAVKSSEGELQQRRQSWVFLEDFPKLSDSSAEALRKEVLGALSQYADGIKEPGTKLVR